MCRCGKNNNSIIDSIIDSNISSNINSDNNKNYINCTIINLYKFNHNKFAKRKKNSKGNFETEDFDEGFEKSEDFEEGFGKGFEKSEDFEKGFETEGFEKSEDFDEDFEEDFEKEDNLIEKKMANAEINYIQYKKTNQGTYFGDIINFERNGFGIMYYPEEYECKLYVGIWENNQRHGYGDMVYRDGRIFSGTWKNDKMQGFGKLFYNNLECAGTWKNNILNGYGYYILKDEIYYGIWKNNILDPNHNFESFLSTMYFKMFK